MHDSLGESVDSDGEQASERLRMPLISEMMGLENAGGFASINDLRKTA